MLNRLRLRFHMAASLLRLAQARLDRAHIRLRLTKTALAEQKTQLADAQTQIATLTIDLGQKLRALAERDDQLAAAQDQVGKLTTSIVKLDYDAEVALFNLMAMGQLRQEANEARAWAHHVSEQAALAARIGAG